MRRRASQILGRQFATMKSTVPFLIVGALVAGLASLIVIVVIVGSDPKAEADVMDPNPKPADVSKEAPITENDDASKTSEPTPSSFLEMLRVAQDGQGATEEPKPELLDLEDHLENGELEDFQVRLLKLAYDSASSMPLHPHIKNRSRAQEEVVSAAIDLDQGLRALGYLVGIANWRKGAAYADLAYYCLEKGRKEVIPTLLWYAKQEVGTKSKPKTSQVWRADRIRVKIANVYTRMGEEELALKYEAGVEQSEVGKVDRVRALTLPADEFESQLEQLDSILETENFDRARHALETCVAYYRRFYDKVDRRELLEARVKTAWEKFPVHARLMLMFDLVESALGYEDQKNAVELLDYSTDLLNSARWLPEAKIPLLGQMAGYRFRAGEVESAREQVESALRLFEKERKLITDVFRSETLLPVAEAYRAQGDEAASLKVYKMAVEEGRGNPNSWPRSVDLCAAACSMALNGVEPDEELWTVMEEILSGFDKGW